MMSVNLYILNNTQKACESENAGFVWCRLYVEKKRTAVSDFRYFETIYSERSSAKWWASRRRRVQVERLSGSNICRDRTRTDLIFLRVLWQNKCLLLFCFWWPYLLVYAISVRSANMWRIRWIKWKFSREVGDPKFAPISCPPLVS